LPAHDLIVNGVGDPDLSVLALDRALRLLAKTRAPVINHPGRILATGRAANAERLGRLAGVIAPRTLVLAHAELAGADAADLLERSGFRFPLLLRAPGYHTGQHFLKVDTVDGLGDAVASLPGATLAIIQYLDTRRADGKWRKYRVMFIGGALYPLHLAVSAQWKVHYFSAEMALEPSHRAEEAAFLDDMASVLGAPAMAALGRIADALGLDYAGVDFALDGDGRVVLFEANATMVILPVASGEHWSYRRPANERAIEAVRALFLAGARTGKRG
jgi:glutathione synthase/RimK-type ligase-like ATP-grasp enzyme